MMMTRTILTLIGAGGGSLALLAGLMLVLGAAFSGAEQLAYLASRSGARDLVLLDTHRQISVNLTRTGRVDPIIRPHWSPDGRALAYASGFDLYVIDIASGRTQQLTAGMGLVSFLTWSPDSDALAFIAQDGPVQSVYSVRLNEAAEPLRLSDGRTTAYSPSWSPDGAHIAFVEPRGGVWLVDLRRGTQGQLTADSLIVDEIGIDGSIPFAQLLVWSPDGEQIAFSAQDTGGQYLYLIDADGERIRRLSNFGREDGWPVWSPDGERVAFVSGRGNNKHIHIHDLNTAHIEQITLGALPDWSSNGAALAFTRQIGGQQTVHTLRFSTGAVEIITPPDVTGYYPVWRPR